jgi:signal transduction histidine kinase
VIEKIRKKLILKYTVVVAFMLFIGFTASYTAYRHTGIKVLRDGLKDFLNEEVWEARESFQQGIEIPQIHRFKTDIKSLHNFTYWVVDKKIVQADKASDDVLAQKIEQIVLNRNFEDNTFYHENIKYDKHKWYFLIIKETVKISQVSMGEVFVLANYTPIRKSAKTYIKIALNAGLIMILLSYLIGNFLAYRSMRYIEKSYQKQKQFVSDAAHELRTPLTILYSYTELLEYSPHKKELIGDIKNEIQLMNNMVDRLLAIARYENSDMILHCCQFNLVKTISNVILPFEKLYPTATFVYNPKQKRTVIEADKVMIEQLLNILLDNAVKYTGNDKKITLSLTVKGEYVCISIQDNGIGIKDKDIPHIFDRFWRAEQSRHEKGLGLGLSLAETIVTLHKGNISVTSAKNQGTTFIVSLPLKRKV